MLAKQSTLSGTVRFEGIGVHNGKNGVLTLKPSAINSGIILLNSKDPSKIIEVGKVIPIDTQYATVLNNGNGWTISTIEHLMAAIGGLEIDNVIIEVEGTEFPIMDGSSLPFVKEIIKVGTIEQNANKHYITPREVLSFKDEKHSRTLDIIPAKDNDNNLYLEFEADFDHPHIPSSSMQCCLSKEIFLREIAPARTFGVLEQLPFLKQHGLAKGASLDNTVVVTKDGFVNKQRFSDECVRHKILDLLGDLTLLGKKLVGTIKAKRTGHSFNRKVIEHYIISPEKWVII